MKNITFFVGLIFVVNVYAQPILNSSDLNALNINANFFEVSSNTISAGAGGANVTWNFSSLPLGPATPTTIVTVSTAPFASNFPSANYFLKVNNEFYGYHNRTATKLEINGNSTSTIATPNYPNPETVYVFPFTYNLTVNDTYQEDLSEPIVSKVIVYDGYGTVITPYGTFTDCLRFKTTTSDNSDITYEWLKLNPFRPVVTSYTNGNLTTFFDFYQITNLNETAFKKSSISVYPNPATDIINITMAENADFDAIIIQDISGKTVFEQNKRENIAAINVENFSSGLYLISTFVDNKKVTTKFLKK